VRATIVAFEGAGLILKRGVRRHFTVAYGEILTAERSRSGRGLKLHTVTGDRLRVACRRGDQYRVEEELRLRGVLIVDMWGAIIAPTMLDFEDELAREPRRVRQSSDDA
jgi:hypothetical protein